MKSSLQIAQRSPEALAVEFFQQSAGRWRSERRYYTLRSEEVQEVISLIDIQVLESDSLDLAHLKQLHKLEEGRPFLGGAKITWESSYVGPGRKPSMGTTLFGISGTRLYRDRGFATPKPITAQFYCPQPRTLCLHTEYNGSVFEEELKLIGSKYRTRQTVISRAGEEQTIGQYLEKRLAVSHEQ